MENQLIATSVRTAISPDYIIYSYALTAVILGWLLFHTLRMLKRSQAKLKKAEGLRQLP